MPAILLLHLTAAGSLLLLAHSEPPEQSRNGQDTSHVTVGGSQRQWHKVTLTFDGPRAEERDVDPNPFLDYRLQVAFTHESGEPSLSVPGYFAADGNAGETSATAGTKWRVHFSPGRPGTWTYRASFVRGTDVAIEPSSIGEPVPPLDGASGSLTIEASNATGRDFRAHGRLEYVGGHYLQFAGSKRYFLKAGADSPETLLAYADFDGTRAATAAAPLKAWAAHVQDWRPGDPFWKDGRGKGLIGALNYLASAGANAFSFLTYNAGGDGDNVWPFVARDDPRHYDVSKLDQWQVVFDHAQRLGLFLHFKLQETENDDRRAGPDRSAADVPTALDGGAHGPERKLYYRELVARYGYLLALNWNLGEENTQTAEEHLAMAAYSRAVDPYDHHLVVHTYPHEQERVYTPLLGTRSVLTGASLQNPWDAAHDRVLQWRAASAAAGRPWVVANDEQGHSSLGVPPDPGFRGFSGTAREEGGRTYTLHDIRKRTLWGTLMAGGAGVEYYFGYSLPQNDLLCEDFRSRDRSWAYARIALELFERERIPFWDMTNVDELVGGPASSGDPYALAKVGEIYVVYLPAGGDATLDLANAAGAFDVRWYNPRSGGALVYGTRLQVVGGGSVSLGAPPADPGEDWVVIVRRQESP